MSNQAAQIQSLKQAFMAKRQYDSKGHATAQAVVNSCTMREVEAGGAFITSLFESYMKYGSLTEKQAYWAAKWAVENNKYN